MKIIMTRRDQFINLMMNTVIMVMMVVTMMICNVAQLEELDDDDGERRRRVTMIIWDVAQPEVQQLFCIETRLRRDDATFDDDTNDDHNAQTNIKTN